MHYLLYNPLANNYHACDDIHKVLELHKEINYEQIDLVNNDFDIKINHLFNNKTKRINKL